MVLLIQKILSESNLGRRDWNEANLLRESFVQACRRNARDVSDHDETPTPMAIYTHLLAVTIVLGRRMITSGNREEMYTGRYPCHYRRIRG